MGMTVMTPTVNWKLHIQGSIGNKFPSIYNHCGIMAAWSRKTLEKFFWKRPITEKFSKFCFERIYRQTDRCVVFKFCEIWPTGNRLPDEKFAWFCSSRYYADHAQNLPRPAPDNVLRVRQTPSRSVHFRRSYTRARKVNPVFGWSLAS